MTDKSDSHEHPVDFNDYLRRCLYVFIAVLCATSLMIVVVVSADITTGRSKWRLILAIACCNAFVVAGFLMHLLSEKKMIYTLLAFTVFFFAGLMGLTLYAHARFSDRHQTH